MARAYVGISAPLIVMAVLLMQGVTTPGYEPIRQTISELGIGWSGTRIVAVYGIVLLTCVWPMMSKALPATPSTLAFIGALVAIGLGCVGLDQVTAESSAWHRMTWRGQLHLIFAFGFVFSAIPVACLAASRALPSSRRGLRAYSLATGLACLALLVGTLIALGKPSNSYVVAHLGLIERLYVFAFMIWQCIVSARLTRSTHKDTR